MDFIRELKSAGLVSKKLAERVVLGTEQAPAAVNPQLTQTDNNISGQSTADNPVQQQAPQQQSAEPQGKSQKEYLMNACMSALGVVEACMESACDAKCFETAQLDQLAVSEMQNMLNLVKEWKGKMEQWAQAPAAAPAPAANPAAQQQAPVQQQSQQPQATSVQAPPSPITGSAA